MKKPNKNVVHPGDGQGRHKAKKSLGQNFLKSEAILNKIVAGAELKESDTVLEIGPGKGALTEKLIEKAQKVIAVEKDNNLFAFLQEKFKEEIQNQKLLLINDDILLFDPIKTLSIPGMDRGYYKIVANIPYNITGAILKKFLAGDGKNDLQPKSMTLLVQKEVAQRIVARSNPKKPNKNVVHPGDGQGKESLLSISVKAYGIPKMLFKVQARFFSPAPKVDSVVIHIKDISREIFETNNINEGDFWTILRAGFAQKRKKLSNNLKKVIKKEILEEYKDKRAEDLTINDWVEIAKSNKDF